MKRPSGFDRGPERPESNAPGDGESGAEFVGSGAEEAPARSPLLERMRARTAVTPDHAVPQENGGEANPDPDPDLGLGLDADQEMNAETIDLGSVRELRESASDEIEVASPRISALARLRAAREADPVRAAERRVRQAGKMRKARFRRERQRFTIEARRRRRTWLIGLGAVATLAVFVCVGVFTPVMAVRDVQVIGATAVNEKDVAKALAQFDGVPLALVEDAEVHRALEPFPMIQRYAVERIPPHTLTVRIEERVPVISLAGDGGVGIYDAAGVLLTSAEAAPAGVPLGSGAVTDLSSPAFRSAAQALRDMPADLRAQVGAVTASSAQDVTFVLTSGLEVLWGDAEQSKRKAAVLSTMLSSLGEQPVSRIDVSSSEAPVFQ